jgi:hypothetical protein
MADISIIVNGTEYPLSTFGALQAHDGWGMPDIERFSERAPGQHGDTDRGYVLEPRIGTLIFKTPRSDLDSLYTLREQITRLLSPVNHPTIKFVLPYGTRCIDGYYVGGASLPWDSAGWGVQKFSIKIKCAEPTFYDPAGAAWTFQLGGGGTGFAVPTPVPTSIGASTIDQTQVISYPGTAPAYPLIRITGPVTNCIITNNGYTLSFQGYTIAAGDYYELDLRHPAKRIYDAAGVSQSAKLTNASDSVNWRIFECVGGELVHDNSIRVQGSNLTSASKIDITYFDRFLSV